MKVPSLKAAYALGSADVIQEGRLARVMGFDYFQMPTFTAATGFGGVAAFPSAIGCAFSPVAPAPGVRQQLLAYDQCHFALPLASPEAQTSRPASRPA
jgi:hypothetical protein